MVRILGAAIGSCVHVAGVVNFLNLAKSCGCEVVFLGPAIPVNDLIHAAKEWNPDVIAVGYRLSPSTARPLIEELIASVTESGLGEKLFIFGGTPPVCRVAEEYRFFSKTFDGTEMLGEPLTYLKTLPRLLQGFDPASESGSLHEAGDLSRTLLERLKESSPYPLLRHHFGLPDLDATFKGVRRIAESKVLDIISIGPDQNTQEYFFNPEMMCQSADGAGGVPLRCADHLRRLRAEADTGNYPLLRCYSGTNDQLRWAELLQSTICNAWAAIPLYWYSILDGRSKRSVEQAVRENQEAMRWHAARAIPVEVNESHHWSLRDAHDALAVAAAYLAAYNAKAMGVSTYIAQFMLNTPPNVSFEADLAKMLAKIETIGMLEDVNFRVLRQVRAGLLSFSADLDIAKGQLAASTVQGLFLKPDIIHVVGYSEADHAATADDVIESCKIVRGVLRNCAFGMPDISNISSLTEQRDRLVSEAMLIIDSVRQLAASLTAGDPLTDPKVLADAVRIGIFDTPHFIATETTRGKLSTRIAKGSCIAVNPATGEPWSEQQRLARLLSL